MLFPAKALIVLSSFLLSANHGPGPPALVVAATSEVNNNVTGNLNFRDLEHYLVAEFLSRRVENVVPLSTLERSQTPPHPGSYIVEFSIEEADTAVRPRWDWTERRFTDDGILHLEVSLTLRRARDDAVVGGLYEIHDYRAQDYGNFSTPQAVRGATYQAAASLLDEFVQAASHGEFGEALATIERPDTLYDLVHDWTELSPESKVATAALTLVAAIVALGIAIRIILAVLRLIYKILVPSDLRPPVAEPYPRLQPVLAPIRARESEEDDEEEEEEEE